MLVYPMYTNIYIYILVSGDTTIYLCYLQATQYYFIQVFVISQVYIEIFKSHLVLFLIQEAIEHMGHKKVWFVIIFVL